MSEFHKKYVKNIMEYMIVYDWVINKKQTLDIKKLINNSEYFKIDDNYYQIFNNINGYVLDDNLLFSSPVGNYASKLKILFYKILISNNVKSDFQDQYQERIKYEQNVQLNKIHNEIGIYNKNEAIEEFEKLQFLRIHLY